MKTQTALYSKIADEYYQSDLHPTCAVLRQASLNLLKPFVQGLNSASRVLEMGCGRSVFCEAFAGGFKGPLWLIDESLEMLAHSADLENADISTAVRVAWDTALANSSFDLIICSLGDPYNTGPFWQEVERLLSPKGSVVFTTPSYEWSNAYRSLADDPEHEAIFQLSNGNTVRTPSYILPIESQKHLLHEKGLIVDEIVKCRKGIIDCSNAPKTNSLSADEPLVTLFKVSRLL